MQRRIFLKKTVGSACAISISPLILSPIETMTGLTRQSDGDLKLSLAQWSLHRNFERGDLDPMNFAAIAIDTYSLHAVEYVNSFYKNLGEDESFWTTMRDRSDSVGVKNLLIMVDEEGDLGLANDTERKKSVENHYKWINAAKILGCHSIRVNAFGEQNKEDFRSATIDGMGQLAEYAAKENINVIIENHGLFSSDSQLIVDIVKQVNKPNFGTFPDFGNWCLSAKWGSTQHECDRSYDRYQGVAEFLPFAKAVSAKSYNFNERGEDTKIDYYKMLKIVKTSGYDGYIGIEYEGEILSEHEGILATKSLLSRVWESLR
ncbi:MAG: sugar phosphate isomerase/epimerase [Saprospiraceae bacterium]|nr:sugar phosphate isomerase/epimerase [Saprospiraceae bacterium]